MGCFLLWVPQGSHICITKTIQKGQNKKFYLLEWQNKGFAITFRGNSMCLSLPTPATHRRLSDSPHTVYAHVRHFWHQTVLRSRGLQGTILHNTQFGISLSSLSNPTPSIIIFWLQRNSHLACRWNRFTVLLSSLHCGFGRHTSSSERGSSFAVFVIFLNKYLTKVLMTVKFLALVGSIALFFLKFR